MRTLVVASLVVCTAAARAQLIVGSTAGQLFHINLQTNTATALTLPSSANQVNGLAADNQNRTLFWTNQAGTTLFRSAPFSGANVPFGATFTIGSSPIITGLGFGPFGPLIGAISDTSQAISINPNSGSTTTFVSALATRMEGLDYGYNKDRFYMVQDVINGTLLRGLYELVLPFTRVGTLGTAFPDVDGVAILGDTAYLASGTVGQPIQLMNIHTGQLTGTLPNPLTATAVYVGATIAPFLADQRRLVVAYDLQSIVTNPVEKRLLSYAVRFGTQTIASGSFMTWTPQARFEVLIPLTAGPQVEVEVGGASFLTSKLLVNIPGSVRNVFAPVSSPLMIYNGDANDSGEIDLTDIDMIIGNYLGTSSNVPGNITDLDCDGEVDLTDIDIAISNYLRSDQ